MYLCTMICRYVIVFYWILGVCLLMAGQARAQYSRDAQQLLTALQKEQEDPNVVIESFYKDYIILNSHEKVIAVLENVLDYLPEKRFDNTKARLYFWLGDAYKHEISNDKRYIQRVEKRLNQALKEFANDCRKIEIYNLMGTIFAHENLKDYVTAKQYFEKAIRLYHQSKCEADLLATQYFEIGFSIYEKIGNQALALQYKTKAINVADSLNVPAEKKVFYQDQVARLYYKTDNFTQAYQIWKKNLPTLQAQPNKTRQLIQLYNNLGLVKRKKMDLDSAIYWFEKTIAEAKSQKDSIWIGISEGNLGISYFLQKKYPQAIALIEKDIRTCLRYKEYGNAVSSLTFLGNVYLEMGEAEKARMYYDSTLHYVNKERAWVTKYQPNEDLKIYMETYKGLALVFEKLKNPEKSYNYLKLHLNYKDSLFELRYKENLALKQASYDFEITQKEREAYIRQQNWYIWFLCISLIFLGVITIAGYRNLKLLSKQKRLEAENLKLAHEAEKERNMRLNEAITLKEQELAINALQIHQKNEVLQELKKEIHTAEKPDKKLEKIVDYSIDLDADWEEFKQHFEQVHPLFFQKLQQNFDKITFNDLKHCAYIRINLDIKQIAYLMRIAPDSVKMSRNRLRKKLGLKPEADLYKYLANL